ncbi:hypothetical protein CRUP_006578 [Coryphaenoides rupestris]|nr:hypothetical protein CRUP_006578 [Coryphaenoides rupestris]
MWRVNNTPGGRCFCPDGLVWYSAPEGHLMIYRGLDVYLNDSVYDGITSDSPIYGMWPGYDYLGWNNKSFPRGYVEMVFNFDHVRNFTSMKVRCSNMFSRGVKLFRQASCFFRSRGEWEADPVSFKPPADRVSQGARFVTVPLGGRTASTIKCRLHFGDLWMLISEVAFQSGSAVYNTSLTPHGLVWYSAPEGHLMIYRGLDVYLNDSVYDGITSDSPIYGMWPGYDYLGWNNKSFPRGYVEMVFNFDHVRNFTSMKADIISLQGGPGSASSCPSLTASFSLLAGREVHLCEAEGMQDFLEEEAGTVTKRAPWLTRSAGGLKETGSASHSPRDLKKQLACRKSFTPRLNMLLQRTCRVTRQLHLREDLPAERRLPGALPADPQAARVCPVHRKPPLQGGPGSASSCPSLTASFSLLAGREVTVREFPRERLCFREKLGEGQFGEVHLCEAEGMQDFLEEEASAERGGEGEGERERPPLLVAVKTLREDANKNARNDFLKEIRIMWRLRDPNIVRLLAVCVDTDPLCMITEYMENGDLNQFLHQLRLREGPAATDEEQEEEQDEEEEEVVGNVVSYRKLMSMAVQIASGMKYLSSLNFVHRDLATRNCLVGRSCTIKIADFGMSRNLYRGDYYRIQGRAVLPIRWMSWESILLGKFTMASDVWAFAVTLWEILTLCQEQPYCQFSDEQVIENTGEFFRDQGKQVYLPKPACCPDDMYTDLMLSCWRRNAKQRPGFQVIHHRLMEEESAARSMLASA